MIEIEKTYKDDDINKLAYFHKLYIPSGFISSLGNRFLSILYKHISESTVSFSLVAKDNEKIIGFITGTENLSKFYKDFFMKKFFVAFFTLLPYFFNPKIIFKISETFLYPKRKNKISKNMPTAELLSIVVDKEYREKGVAKKLFQELVNEYKKRGINEFKVIVGSNLLNAIKFYEKMGCRYLDKIQVHKGEDSLIYVYNIDD